MLRERIRLKQEVLWSRSYDRAGVERFLALAETERARRLDEIQAARRRVAAAEARAGAPHIHARARLADMVVAAHLELAEERRTSELAVAAVLDEADAEAARVLAAANDEARSRRDWSWRTGVDPQQV